MIRVPDSKSIPRLSCFVANAIAPTSRMIPEIEKNQRLAPMKSKCHPSPSPDAPSAAGERMNRARPKTPRIAWVNSTAVKSETIVPMPSVNAKPLTPAEASTKRMNAVISVITFASMIVAMPLR